MTRRNRRRLLKYALAFLAWLIPSPLYSPWPADLLAALLRARDVARSLVPDAPSRDYVYVSAPRCAGENQVNAVLPDTWRVFEHMNANDCDTMLRVATNTSLTPGTGQLRVTLYAPVIAHASATIANDTQTNVSTQ